MALQLFREVGYILHVLLHFRELLDIADALAEVLIDLVVLGRVGSCGFAHLLREKVQELLRELLVFGHNEVFDFLAVDLENTQCHIVRDVLFAFLRGSTVFGDLVLDVQQQPDVIE